MKAVKRLSVLLAVLLVVSLAIGFAVSAEGDAIVVTNETEFLAAMDAANANANIVLANDITLTAGNATMNATYTGTFDGAGYTINGITNTLFKKAGGTAVVKNVTLNGAIDYTASAGVVEQRKAATIAADADSGAAFKNIVSNVDIATAANDLNAGGIVGYGKANTFENVTYAGDYTVNWNGNSGSAGVGGIIGYTNNGGTSNYINCAFTGSITVTSEAKRNTLDLGGIIGIARNGENNFENCVCTGDLNVTADVTAKNVGYVVGWNRDDSATIAIKNCFSYADADVTGFIGSGAVATDEGNVIATPVATADEFRTAIAEKKAYIVLTADIDLGEAGNVTLEDTFSGVFDGQGKTISGITNTLFKQLTGTFKNVTLNGAIVADGTAEGADNNELRKTATVARDARDGAVVENVVSNVDITLTSFNLNAGGIVGYAKAVTMKNVTYAGDLTVNWTNNDAGIGGIVGWSSIGASDTSEYIDCVFTGSITVNETAGAGKTGSISAILGLAKGGKHVISRAINAGELAVNTGGAGYNWFGGIVAAFDNATNSTITGSLVAPKNVLVNGNPNTQRTFFAKAIGCTITGFGAFHMADGSWIANDGEGFAAVLKYMPADAVVKLAADVTLPAGTPTYTTGDFSGTLDGQGKTVSGLSHTLFKKIKGGTVKNITFEGELNYDASVDGKDPARKAATLAWDAANVTLENVTSNVNITTVAYDLNAGGIIGYANEATFTNCVYGGTYTATWTDADGAVGGIAGYIRTNSGTNVYTNCAFTGTLNVNGGVDGKSMYVGGLVGKHRQQTVNVVDFTNTGVINVETTKGNIYVGGFIGTDNDVATLTMSGLFDGTITAPEGATVDPFLADDAGSPADLSGCKKLAKFDQGTIILDKDGAYLLGTDSYAAFLSVRDGATEGTQDYRFVIVADGATYKAGTDVKLALTFTKDGAAVKTLTKTFAELDLYAKATAAGNVYVAAEGCFLTGIVVTGVPADAWDTVTVTVVDGETTLAEGEVANANISDETLYTYTENSVELYSSGTVYSIGVETHHEAHGFNPAFVLCLDGADIYGDIYANGAYNPNYIWYMTVNDGAEFVPASFSCYDGGSWGYLRAELGAAYADAKKYDMTLVIVNIETGEVAYYGDFYIHNDFIYDETKPEDITVVAPEDITVTAGPDLDGGEGAKKAFDGKHDTKVCTGDVGADNALIVELKNTINLKGVGICNANDNEGNTGRTVLDFVIYVSADGENWGEPVYTATGEGKDKADYSTNFQEIYYDFASAVGAKYVKIVVNNDGMYQISDVLLYQSTGTLMPETHLNFYFEESKDGAKNLVYWFHQNYDADAPATKLANGEYVLDLVVNGEEFKNVSASIITASGRYLVMNIEALGVKGIKAGNYYDCSLTIKDTAGNRVYYTAPFSAGNYQRKAGCPYDLYPNALPKAGITQVVVDTNTVTFDKEFWTANPPACVFDGDTVNTKLGTNKAASQPVTLTFSLTEAATITHYTFWTGTDTLTKYPNRNPKAWVMYGKVGEEWVVLSEVTEPGMVDIWATPYSYAVTNPVECKDYKIVFETSSDIFQLNEIELYKKDATVTTPTAAALIDGAQVMFPHALGFNADVNRIRTTIKSDAGQLNETSIAQLTKETSYVWVKDITNNGGFVRYEVAELETARWCDINFILDGFTPVSGTKYEIAFFTMSGDAATTPNALHVLHFFWTTP